jgi:3-hydroxyacyl-CoA dehydrogenase
VSLVNVKKSDGVGLLTIDNPPVNALSPDVQYAVAQGIKSLVGDEGVSAIVVHGTGRNFVAGADIKKFVEISMGEAPFSEEGLQPLLRLIEDCPKPVVMAIHGFALGGGLELAMAGHYRVAVPDASLGQAEVKLGLMPGGGGTQRLPRLVGLKKGVEMCYTGDPISAREATDLGLVDKLIDGDLVEESIAFARQISSKKPLKTRERVEKLGAPAINADLFDAARQTARIKYRNLEAPLVAIDAVEAGLQLAFEEACRLERQKFKSCLFSSQSKALIHVFFAERDVVKIPDVPKDTPTFSVKSAAVLGAGTMGAGIAMVLANAGIAVLLKETDQTALDRGRASIQKNYANAIKRGRMTQALADGRMKLITPALSWDGFEKTDLVIEAAFENMALKKKLFQHLDNICKPTAILASNTSTLSIDEIASATTRPEFVIGTHFFSPANVMKLLEIVRGKATQKEVIASCMQLAKKIGKIGVLVGNGKGFVGNRMFHAYRREAQFLVEEGATPDQVDTALYDFGMAMGPLAAADLAGIDVGWRIRQEHRHLLEPGVRQPFIENKLCEIGRYGQKTGAGWYKYDEDRTRTSDPETGALVRRWRSEAGIQQREISTQEILDRCLLALVNEGARILDERLALRAGDIDVIFVNGYGFPAYRGGPMWYADSLGLDSVYRRVCKLQQDLGSFWEPARLLKKLADAGQTFSSHSTAA